MEGRVLFMIFAAGLSFPEGPVLLPDKSWLVVEGGPDRGRVTHISSDGKTLEIVARTGRPNGLAIDRSGYVWIAESKVPSLLRMDLEGRTEVFATGCDGEPFLFPNDLCFGPDGALYLTDSGVHIDEFAPGGKIRSDYDQVKYDGRIYCVDTKRGTIRKLDSGIKFANGIALGPDLHLYVSETATGMIYRYRIQEGVGVGRRESFANVLVAEGPPGWRGPDGMAFDQRGDLYVAVFNQQDVTIVNRDGSISQRLTTQGKMPTNCAFGPPNQQGLYVTEYQHGQVEAYEIGIAGLPLWT